MNTTATFIHIASVTARFIRTGEVIERASHLMRVVGGAVPCAVDPSRVQVMVVDLESDDDTAFYVSIHRDVMVKTYDEI